MRFFVIFSLMCINVAYASSNHCDLLLKPRGIFFNSCPVGTLADGVDAYHPGPSPWPQVRVRCVKPEIVCRNLNKPLFSDDDISVVPTTDDYVGNLQNR
jgi:hypothetical protein